MIILVIDDHGIVREGLKQIFKEMDTVSTVDEAATGGEALQKLAGHAYDLITLDISLPDMNGFDVLRVIKNRNPGANVLILSMHPEEQYAARAFKLGAAGYLSKSGAFSELRTALTQIKNGKKYISAELAEKLLFSGTDAEQAPHEKLSEREFQVFCLLARGKTVTEIAELLFISDKTVSTHRTRILEKMGFRKNAELTLYAVKNNIIE